MADSSQPELRVGTSSGPRKIFAGSAAVIRYVKASSFLPSSATDQGALGLEVVIRQWGGLLFFECRLADQSDSKFGESLCR